ncbi:bifunctional DNA-binding transcriptional regulator/O6-methylguanine-DNA methyltransferase Ada [Pseudodesulfovibrio thermohalotolerans]|uniref:bifunctional DNA-binding transcriptional regulator/O6-methylguanine-DNA methyltransferase Ada n=1 Tax=Pseudodesulfovibrio thermohalotolerans TaxID=2880651 RepID=UPI0024430657|nr:bifunctional DNA-binding transcriptional regulator/O6-methylguanine-DNA methyltransferase Ada [Pseudodesulfovibrio thermohalotolerans]WFS62169.1 bifunctional DNA-binding transcriptional regulator/O6-methylguanine-DNA methyltransferase Ada [Pseudodesulfovibrio thermohalotolerans]
MSHEETIRTARLHAVMSRDASAEGFCYAVRTTGVYCRPGCPSRAPRPENVVFFDTPAQAEAAGYRPCKRCRPDDPAHRDIASARIVAACRAIEQTIRDDAPPPLAVLAEDAGLSPSHFQRLFKARTGISPKEYARAMQDERVRRALAQGRSVTEAIHGAGFGSPSRFYERAARTMGMNASVYRKGGKGMTIRHAVAESFLGPVLAGFTDKGVCAIEFGDTPEALVQALRERFPAADIRDGQPEFARLLQEVADFISRPAQGLDLPLDIQGTAFQQRVWRELTRIPPGETRSYTDIALAIERPEAVRAVAAACAANPLAVAVPCHRVLRKSGYLAGYRWGLDRKRALLDREKE